jgi:hypothetical protein
MNRQPDSHSHLPGTPVLVRSAVTDGLVPGLSNNGPRTRMRPPAREDIMHPMFVKLLIETDADDVLAEEDRRRRARRSRRARPATAVRPAARDREHRSRR